MKFWNKKIFNKKFVFIVFKDSYKYGQIIETNEHEDFLLIKMLSTSHSGLFLYHIDKLDKLMILMLLKQFYIVYFWRKKK